VRRLADGKDFVAKVSDSDERRILESLQKKDPPSDHVIRSEGPISTSMGPGILLPIRQPVRELVKQPDPGLYSGRLVHFAVELIMGLAFLHRHGIAHLDIKPDNLVYTDAFKLEIIDFDVAVLVENENVLITDDVGTDEYIAPERLKRDFLDGGMRPYSAIRADRWSCGKTIREFLCWDTEGGQYVDLSHFANRLTSENPASRPPLREWLERKKRSDVNGITYGEFPRKRLKGETDGGDILTYAAADEWTCSENRHPISC
jgi:serine/threonine protein kinase